MNTDLLSLLSELSTYIRAYEGSLRQIRGSSLREKERVIKIERNMNTIIKDSKEGIKDIERDNH